MMTRRRVKNLKTNVNNASVPKHPSAAAEPTKMRTKMRMYLKTVMKNRTTIWR